MMSLKRTLWLGALGCALLGCTKDRSVKFEVTTGVEPNIRVDEERIEIPAGLAVGVRAYPQEDGITEGEVDLDMRPVHAGIIGIEPGLESDDWVIYGVAAGTTDIELFFDNDLVGEVPATVVESHTE